MKEQLMGLLGSVRFWASVVVSVAFLLDSLEVIPGAYAKSLELFGVLGISIRVVGDFKK